MSHPSKQLPGVTIQLTFHFDILTSKSSIKPTDHRQKIRHDTLDSKESGAARVILVQIKISVDLEHNTFDSGVILVMLHGHDAA